MTGSELRSKRKLLNLTQEKLAQEVGFERKTIIRLEKMEQIEGSKCTILDNYFKLKNEENGILNKGLEYEGVKVPNEVIAKYVFDEWDMLMKERLFNAKFNHMSALNAIKLLRENQ